MAERDNCQDWRSALQQAQATFYTEALSALEELESVYMREAKVYTHSLGQKGLTFEKDERAVHRKLSSGQLARLTSLYTQLRSKTEALPQSRPASNLLLRLTPFAPPTPPDPDLSLTYSKDSTPACTPKLPLSQPMILSTMEAMAVRLQTQEKQDRAARKAAALANQHWSH